jgi:hypothetical protein
VGVAHGLLGLVELDVVGPVGQGLGLGVAVTGGGVQPLAQRG